MFLRNLCLQLDRLGHDVQVLVPWMRSCEESDADLPYQVHRYSDRQRLSSLVPLRETIALHRCYRYDLIFIGHFVTTHALGALVLRVLRKVPYAILCHGNDLHYSLTNWMDRVVAYPLLRKASMVLCNSRATARRVREKGYRGPIKVLHPGVDPDEFRPKLSAQAITERYDLDGRKVLLSVSRLVKRKGHDRVLRALPRVIEEVPNVLYLIAGRGEEEASLRRMVDELGLGGHVVFAGYVEQTLLPSLYCASDLFIMPSFSRDDGHDYEGFGIVFSEANACGLPVIGGRSGGAEDAIIHGETGLLVDPLDVGEIAKAITHLLTDEKLAKKLGTNGRRRVEQELGWNWVGQRLVSCLQEIVA